MPPWHLPSSAFKPASSPTSKARPEHSLVNLAHEGDESASDHDAKGNCPPFRLQLNLQALNGYKLSCLHEDCATGVLTEQLPVRLRLFYSALPQLGELHVDPKQTILLWRQPQAVPVAIVN